MPIRQTVGKKFSQTIKWTRKKREGDIPRKPKHQMIIRFPKTLKDEVTKKNF
jgi:hypothetical protein